ncbi:MAG TPA: hypothetical protein VMZ49_00595, partial [Patescibacteria group bacterium]|nr:hypothetical protein [Patescibacteria group bacterium]
MKKSIIISSLLLVVAIVIDAEQKEFPKLTGPYLGQRLPGTTPELFAPGIISTGLHEGVCTFMPDGSEIIFNVLYRKPHSHSVYSSLVASRLVNGQWAPPEVLKFSGGKNLDTAPFISYDGKELFFESNRPTNRADLKNKTNIWRCSRTPAGWSDPEPLPSPINGRGNVFGPSMSSSGAFYFTLADAKGNSAIYASHFSAGKFSEPKRLPECVNVKQGTFDGVISPDGSYYIVCVYNKEDSLGETDMYITFKNERSDWTPLKNLGKAINTERNDGSAKISPDGKIIFFAGCLVSHNYYNDALTYADILNNILKPQYGNSDIYWISAEFI